MKIRQKLILGFVSIALLVEVVGYISVNISQKTLKKEIGKNTVMLAKETLDKIDREVHHKIEIMKAYSNGLILHESLIKSNQEFEKLGSIDVYIKQKDKEFTSTPKGTMTPFMEELTNNKLAKELKEELGFYKGEHGHRIFPEIYATNRYGVVIASTGRTSDYFQADEEWYQKATAEKSFWVGNIEYDESSDTYASDIVVNVYDNEGDFLGILKAVLNIEEVINIMKNKEATVEYDTTEFKLITKDKKIIYSTEGFEFFEEISPEFFSSFEKAEQAEYFIAKGDTPGEGEELFAHAQSKGHGDYKGLGWRLIVDYETEEIFAPVAKLRNTLLLISLGVTTLALMVALFISHFISTPITKLKDSAAEIGAGNFDTNIEVKSNDEIGQLGASFKNMAEDLKITTTSIHKLNNEIAQRKKADEEIRQQNEFLNNILESLTHPFYVIDANDYTIKIANSAANLGDLPEKTTCYALTHKRDKPCTDGHICPLQEVKKTKKPVVVEHIHYDKDGNTRNVEVHGYPIFDKEGNVVQMIEYSLDITERRKAREILKKALDEWESTFNAARDPIMLINTESKIVQVNLATSRFLCKPLDEILGKTCHQLFHGTDAAIELCPLARAKQTRKHEEVELRVPEKDMWIVTSVDPILDDQGNISSAVHIIRDITEHKKAEEVLERLNEDLESAVRELNRSNKELQDFAYVTAHDLKSPLRAIGALAHWISTDYADKFDEDGREQMKLLTDRVKRMHNLIEAILQYSRVGREKEKHVQVNLNELVPAVIDMVAPPRNIAITTENQLPVIECEETRIIQVFQNLLSNAVKHLDKPQGQIRIGCVEEDGFWKFSVADNGLGIEEKYFKKIFEIFQTLSPRDQVANTGIGLSIVKKIVKVYGGRVWVESKPGEGSTFFFTLPKQAEETTDVKLKADIAC